MNKGCLFSLSYVEFDSINRWHGKNYSCHGKNHKSSWFVHRHSGFGLQTYNYSIHDAILGDIKLFVYIKVSETNRAKVKVILMKYS